MLLEFTNQQQSDQRRTVQFSKIDLYLKREYALHEFHFQRD